MRVFLGMILGAILTVVGALSYDVLSNKFLTAPDQGASVAIDVRPMVNWDVVGRNWHTLERNVREMVVRVQEQWSKRSG